MRWNTPISIGRFISRNRIVFPAVSGNWATTDGAVTEKIVDFHREIAGGGCGVVVVGSAAVDLGCKGSSRSLVFERARQIPGYARLAAAISGEGALPVLQLMHVGGQGNPDFTGCAPVSPSGGVCMSTGYESRALTQEEIAVIVQKFATAALLAAEAGFQAVELHFAHGYLLHEFLSPHANHRTDEYGGSADNRLRLPLAIIKRIRQEAPVLEIGARVSGEDYLVDGLGLNENRYIIPLLEKAGIAYFSVTAGIYETSARKHAAMARGEFMGYARTVRSLVHVPTIGVGKILTIVEADRHLESGNCDLVAMGRALLADPKLPEKQLSGQPQVLCTQCDKCRYLYHGLPDLQCTVRENQA